MYLRIELKCDNRLKFTREQFIVKVLKAYKKLFGFYMIQHSLKMWIRDEGSTEWNKIKYQLINLFYGSVIMEGTYEECKKEADKYGLCRLLVEIRRVK